ncbi:hypothetical protein SO694_00023458 [Aureococcus anophagefferens]|uniref:Ankyrin repeat domain-containing protein n=1 Tax=Aureococcus anophagefferens TaxID=44056 RepID=A0ABR1FTX1_AURAN|nr:hypothetical protein JL720_2158 [Aureococcus anophagefferens]
MDDIADSSELDELFRQAAIHGDVDEMRALRAQGANVFLRGGAREFATDVGHAVALADDLPIRRPHNKSAFEVVDAIHAAGGWAEYVKAHRRVLSSLVSKLSAKNTTRPIPFDAKNTTRPIPFDAASHVSLFWCPPGGY